MAVVGGVAAILTGLIGSWAFAAIVGWAAASLTYTAWVWIAVGRMDAKATANHATREDPSWRVTDLLLVLASLASLGAVAFILTYSRSAAGAGKGVSAGLAVLSVALSWALVHTLFTLRYASLYYQGTPGGINFNQDPEKDPPRYSDFAYVSFTLGMTFQVSDTNLGTHAIRATALRQGLLSYLFGSIVLATVINLIAGLN